MFMQIPHHGGRHNVNPAVLNQLLGNKCGRETDREIVAFVSSAENSDHPYKMVVNVYLRRGAKVMKSGGILFCIVVRCLQEQIIIQLNLKSLTAM